MVLQVEKVEQPTKMQTVNPLECPHADEDRDYRGTTGTTWRWKCKACGHRASGDKSPGETARSASSRTAQSVKPSPTTPIKTPYVTPSSSSATIDEDHDVDKIVDLVRHVVNVQRDMGQRVSITQLDRIYDRCRSNVMSDVRRSPQAPPDRSRSGSANRAMPGNATPTSPAPSPTTPLRPGEVSSRCSHFGWRDLAGRSLLWKDLLRCLCQRDELPQIYGGQVAQWIFEQYPHHQLCQVRRETSCPGISRSIKSFWISICLHDDRERHRCG